MSTRTSPKVVNYDRKRGRRNSIAHIRSPALRCRSPTEWERTVPRKNQYASGPIIPGQRPPRPENMDAEELEIWTQLTTNLPTERVDVWFEISENYARSVKA
jgi:hypothetical protein